MFSFDTYKKRLLTCFEHNQFTGEKRANSFEDLHNFCAAVWKHYDMGVPVESLLGHVEDCLKACSKECNSAFKVLENLLMDISNMNANSAALNKVLSSFKYDQGCDLLTLAGALECADLEAKRSVRVVVNGTYSLKTLKFGDALAENCCFNASGGSFAHNSYGQNFRTLLEIIISEQGMVTPTHNAIILHSMIISECDIGEIDFFMKEVDFDWHELAKQAYNNTYGNSCFTRFKHEFVGRALKVLTCDEFVASDAFGEMLLGMSASSVRMLKELSIILESMPDLTLAPTLASEVFTNCTERTFTDSNVDESMMRRLYAMSDLDSDNLRHIVSNLQKRDHYVDAKMIAVLESLTSEEPATSSFIEIVEGGESAHGI